VKIEAMQVFEEVAKCIVGGLGGTAIGYHAQKKAAKSEAVTEMQLLKTEYKEFAEFTKTELLISRSDREKCQIENEILHSEIGSLKSHVNELTMTMHNVIGTSKNKRK
jgi:predicted phage-related endonuclease